MVSKLFFFLACAAASPLIKRDNNKVVEHLDNIGTSIDALNTDLSSYSGNPLSLAAIKLKTSANSLADVMGKAVSDVKLEPTPMSEAEAGELLKAVNRIKPKVKTITDTVMGKDFGAIKPIVKSEMSKFKDVETELEKELVNRVPVALQGEAKNQGEEMKASFNAAITKLVPIDSLPRRIELPKRGHRGPKSKHGCRQCKTRRIKCSEEKPVCLQCSKKSMTCEYGPSQAIATATTSNASTPRPQSVSATSGASPISALGRSPGEPADEETMLTEVFFATTTHLFSIYTGPCNPFMRLRKYIPHSRALHLAAQAMAAFTISGNQSSDKEKHMNRGLELQRLAYQEITRAMSDPNQAHSDATFAAVVHIGMTEPWHTMRSSESGVMHLKTSKVLICHRAESGRCMPPRFLTNLLIYWDLLVSLHSDTTHEGYTTGLLAGPAADAEASDYIDPTLGLAFDLFPVIIEMETFVRYVRLHPSPESLPMAHTLHHRLASWRPQVDGDRLIHCTGVFETASLQDILFTAEAYRQTALLLLFRMVPGMLATMQLHESALGLMASQVIRLIQAIQATSPVCTTHQWVLFVVSPDVNSMAERAFVRERMSGLLDKIGIEGIRDVMQYMEEVWRSTDAGVASSLWMEEIYRRRFFPLLG
ncbi:fungal-specific transcription factor domain-domain-containing protein [Protomyces lactucae-debilis]|uniref:Fungal-specific transcription factor domain-domain-containing protein n=1 Tax=Protomyces lactucae-debilis TaxID=2754530 RepID=A0A1Y2EXT4_PROLT|nr:fungal-specific transcription factor domain-containing protein [Protomyces lactucae-debilis]ORY76388.1 fungal-specific transcription factor domain-domain-containing protein [Protomyces lactucae-debilis]